MYRLFNHNFKNKLLTFADIISSFQAKVISGKNSVGLGSVNVNRIMYRLFNYNLKNKLLTFAGIISNFPLPPFFTLTLVRFSIPPPPPPTPSTADIICERSQMMKNAYFSFRPQDIKIFVSTFWLCRKTA